MSIKHRRLSWTSLALWTLTIAVGWAPGWSFIMLTVRDSMLASPDVFVLAFSSMFGATIGLIGGVIIMAGQLLHLPNRVTAV